VTGLVAHQPGAGQRREPPEPAQGSLTRALVLRDLALDLHCALARQGRAPFILSGLPLFEDLQALRQTLVECLALAEEPTLRHWHTVLDRLLLDYESAFADVRQALAWVEQLKSGLDRPLPTDAEPGPGGDAVALDVAHVLGALADLTDLSPWLAQFRNDLLALSQRYWSGLFPCYDIVGLPPTNNDHESLYGQLKRQLRRQLGLSQLAQPWLKRGAWTLFKTKAMSPSDLQQRLAQVSWEDYVAERTRYERRQEHCRRRYRWRHQRDAVLKQRVAAWSKVVSGC
jgi:hypothetical protein